MSFERNPNHAEHGILKFAAPFWGKPRWAALFVAIARQIQDIEDAACDVIEKRMIANATGAQLQVLAKLVRQIDPGLGDEVLRNLIRVRIRVNRSLGRLADLLAVFQLLGVDKANREIVPSPPAKLEIYLSGAMPLPTDMLTDLLNEAAPAGVGVVTLHDIGGAGAFHFLDNTASGPTSGNWSDQATSSGGRWSAVNQ